MPRKNSGSLRVGLAQMAPVWLDREATLEKVIETVDQAARAGCELVVFGEAFVPGYPFWLEHTGGARFDDPLQKTLFAHYAEQAVDIDRGDLDGVRAAARRNAIAIYLGMVERPRDRGGHSLYAGLAYIDAAGDIASLQRKLVPTYEERLVWGQGDGHGLRTHALGPFTVGGLNCWENWMPLVRAALYAEGEDLHISVWPGNPRNTTDIARFIAQEGRCYTIAAAGLLAREEVPRDFPEYAAVVEQLPVTMAAGGSCIAAPCGDWVLAPVVGEAGLLTADLDPRAVHAARQNFDPSGHYARPDVTQLCLDRRRLVVCRHDTK